MTASSFFLFLTVNVLTHLCVPHLSPWTFRSLQRHPRDTEMAVVAVVPAVPTDQFVAGLRVLARHRPPLQQASAAGHPSPCGPDPPGRCSLADGTHRSVPCPPTGRLVTHLCFQRLFRTNGVCNLPKVLVWRWQYLTRDWARSTHILRTSRREPTGPTKRHWMMVSEWVIDWLLLVFVYTELWLFAFLHYFWKTIHSSFYQVFSKRSCWPLVRSCPVFRSRPRNICGGGDRQYEGVSRLRPRLWASHLQSVH